MPKRPIPITHLKVGMYLTGVNRSWFHTPFLRHKFLIKNEHEITALQKAGITEVIIDTDLGLDSDAAEFVIDKPHEQAPSLPVPSSTTAPPSPPQMHQVTPQTLNQLSPVQLANQFSDAKLKRQEWMNRINTLFEQTRATDTVEITAVRHIVDEVLESLLERQAACLAVLGLRQPDPTLQEHGLTVCTLSLTVGKALHLSHDTLGGMGLIECLLG